jgi:pimeloyl-ACP methyl ester carboxylesterase
VVIWSAVTAVSANGFDTVNVTVRPKASLVNIEVLAPDGNPVTQLSTITDTGWPTPNPLTVQVTLSCPDNTAGQCPYLLDLNIDSSNQEARFYVYDSDLTNPPCFTTPADLDSLHSFREYSMSCNPMSLLPGQTATHSWKLWIQPSVTATLGFTATWGADRDSKTVEIPKAAIHPLVIVPGYVATWPPEHGGDLDPLLNSFENLKEAMQKIGYEWGEAGSGATLIPFGWDWREPLGNTGRDVLEADIDLIRNVSNHTKDYVDYGTVDIIAHSAGGLVSRAFIEEASTDNQNKVDKFITLGTPHRGLPSAYRGGRGGQYDAIFFGDPRAATGIVAGLMICNGTYAYWPRAEYVARGIVLNEAKLYEFIQANLPSANDLLPTSDVLPAYLVDSSNS